MAVCTLVPTGCEVDGMLNEKRAGEMVHGGCVKEPILGGEDEQPNFTRCSLFNRGFSNSVCSKANKRYCKKNEMTEMAGLPQRCMEKQINSLPP